MSNRSGELSGQVAIVTGANRGIGQAIALELAQNGAIVAGTSRTPEGIADIDEALSEFDGFGVPLDLRDSSTFEDRVNEVIEIAGGSHVSILVNNAGVTIDGLAARMPETAFREVIEVDLMGPFFLTQAVLKGMMKARYGRIINVSSVVGLSGNPGQANYAAAKAGIIGSGKSVAKELGKRNITVNAVAPGYVPTDMTNELPQDVKDMMLAHTPTGRPVTPEEVAHAVSFLASPRAGSITGEVLRVDGGMAS